MILWCVVVVALVGVLALVALQDRPTRKPVDPEAEARAAVELHRIGRQLDVAELKAEQRRDGSRLRRDIDRALDGEREP